MSAILLPAIRRPSVNLYDYRCAGGYMSSTSNFAVYATVPGGSPALPTIVEMGLSVGDVISASAELRNLTPGDQIKLVIQAKRADASSISSASSAFIDSQSYQRVTIDSFTIPADTDHIRVGVERNTGTGTLEARKGMINRGPTAQPYDIPKRGAWAPLQLPALFGRDNSQEVLRMNSGAVQITSYPSRLWMMNVTTEPLFDDELDDWELAFDQLSDLTNTFRFVPPGHTGPGTDYEGPNPVVNGADQLGTSLNVSGLEASTLIARRGRFVSVDVTTAGGETNAQLLKLAADVTSDASGEATMTFTTPLRLAPANGATVQIYAPTGLFSLTRPQSRVNLELQRMSVFRIEAEERIWL